MLPAHCAQAGQHFSVERLRAAIIKLVRLGKKSDVSSRRLSVYCKMRSRRRTDENPFLRHLTFPDQIISFHLALRQISVRANSAQQYGRIKSAVTAVNSRYIPALRQQNGHARVWIILIRAKDSVDILVVKNAPPSVAHPQTVSQHGIKGFQKVAQQTGIKVSCVKSFFYALPLARELCNLAFSRWDPRRVSGQRRATDMRGQFL